MADTKFMDFAESTPTGSDSILFANTSNGVRRAKLSTLADAIGSGNFVESLSINPNGFIKLGQTFGNLILQWGQIRLGAAGEPSTITFPTEFTTNHITVLANVIDDVGMGTYDVHTYNYRGYDCQIVAHGQADLTVAWFAIGY